MQILNIPKIFQPVYKSSFPPYSNGLNLEEIFYKYYFSKFKDSMKIDRIYIPIFWTSFFILRGYGKNIKDLCDFLDKSLKKNKKYFTIVQNASGIYWDNKNNIDILIFSSGGGGINKSKEKAINRIFLDKIKKYRDIFIGKEAEYFLPLLCFPLLKSIN